MEFSNLQSMTGYAEFDGIEGDTGWRWEMRTVNGKNLDIRLRLPPGFERLEQPARKMISASLKRGNVQAILHIERNKPALVPQINKDALEAVLTAAAQVGERTGGAPPTVEGILALRGVMELREIDIPATEQEMLDKVLISGLEKTLGELTKVRGAEGNALGLVLRDNLEEISRLSNEAEENPSRSVDEIRIRLQEQVTRLLEASGELDMDRLHQEAAILATKADIREEIDRLNAHVEAGLALLNAEGPVGRKLDFLAQEFNREANTLCSKSNVREMTAIGLELKVVIDQFREQLQNLE